MPRDIARVLLLGRYFTGPEAVYVRYRTSAFERRITWYFEYDTVVVMDNKYFITVVSVHIAVIALVGCNFTHLRLVKIPLEPTRQ